MGTILLVILILMLVGVLPTRPHSRSWGYGDKVVFVGFGAGLTWGAAVALWSGPFPARRRARPVSYRIWAKIRSYIHRAVRYLESLIWGGHVG